MGQQVFSPVAKRLTIANKSFRRLPVREMSVGFLSTYSLFHQVLVERRISRIVVFINVTKCLAESEPQAAQTYC